MKTRKLDFLILIAVIFILMTFFILLQDVNYLAHAEGETKEENILLEKNTIVDSALANYIVVDISQSTYLEIPIAGTEYYYEFSGVIIRNIILSGQTKALVEVTFTENQGYISIYSKCEESNFEKNNLYFYLFDNSKLFTSVFSMDEAILEYNYFLYVNGLKSQNQFERDLSSNNNKNVIVNSETKSKTTLIANVSKTTEGETSEVTNISISGRLTWAAQNNVDFPLANMRVDLFENDYITTTYTDENGDYAFSVAPAYSKFYIRVYPDGRTFEVGKNWLTSTYFYYIDSPTVTDLSAGDAHIFDIHLNYDNTNSVNCAFYVAQALAIGEKYFDAMTSGYPENKLKVWYPVISAQTTNFLSWINDHYPNAVLELLTSNFGFCYKDLMGLSVNIFNDYDTIIHEYGHYVEHNMGNYGSSILELIIYGPNHSFGEDSIAEHGNKTFGQELAWSEAWASAFSIISQYYYNDNYYPISGLFNAYDTYFSGRSIELLEQNLYANSSFIGGEADEYAIICFLWDIFDNYTSVEQYDNISLTATIWWRITTIDGTYTLSDFALGIDQTYYNYRNQIGQLMEYYNMSPQALTVNLVSVTNSIITTSSSIWLSWQAGGSDSSKNNSYEVVVYGSTGNKLWMSERITTTSYIIAGESLNAIRNNLSRQSVTLYLGILAYNTQSISSGPFMTATQSFTIVNPLELDNATPYAELRGSSSAGSWKTYNIYFKNPGNKIIQTFGTKNTKIELQDLSGNIIASDNDVGTKVMLLLALLRQQIQCIRLE